VYRISYKKKRQISPSGILRLTLRVDVYTEHLALAAVRLCPVLRLRYADAAPVTDL